MDKNETRPVLPDDWRAHLHPDSRERIVNKLMETLKRHLPVSREEGLQELRKIAVRFEGKIFTSATSQSDYLRKISLKMLTMETKSSTAAGSSNPVTNQRSHPANFTANDKEELANDLYETKEKLTNAIFKFMEELDTAEE